MSDFGLEVRDWIRGRFDTQSNNVGIVRRRFLRRASAHGVERELPGMLRKIARLERIDITNVPVRIELIDHVRRYRHQQCQIRGRIYGVGDISDGGRNKISMNLNSRNFFQRMALNGFFRQRKSEDHIIALLTASQVGDSRRNVRLTFGWFSWSGATADQNRCGANAK